jgi:hypothetical protein
MRPTGRAASGRGCELDVERVEAAEHPRGLVFRKWRAPAVPWQPSKSAGVRWYRLAAWSAQPPLTAAMQVAAGVAERFRAARRILNDVTDRYLLPRRGQLFGLS